MIGESLPHIAKYLEFGLFQEISHGGLYGLKGMTSPSTMRGDR